MDNKALIFVLVFVTSMVHADSIIQYVPKRKYSEYELRELCEIGEEEPLRKRLFEILQTPEKPMRAECRWAVVEKLAWECRSVQSDVDLLNCVDELAVYVNALPVLDAGKKEFLIGDLLVKASRIHEGNNEFDEAVKTLETLLFFSPDKLMADSVFDEISRIYYKARQYDKSVEFISKWLVVLDNYGNTESANPSLDFSYIIAYARLAEIKVNLKDYLGATLALEKLNIHLLGVRDCWIAGWDKLLSMRVAVAEGLGDKQGASYYLRIHKNHNVVFDKLKKIEELEEFGEYEKALTLLDSVESFAVELSFICPGVANEFFELRNKLEQ